MALILKNKRVLEVRCYNPLKFGLIFGTLRYWWVPSCTAKQSVKRGHPSSVRWHRFSLRSTITSGQTNKQTNKQTNRQYMVNSQTSIRTLSHARLRSRTVTWQQSENVSRGAWKTRRRIISFPIQHLMTDEKTLWRTEKKKTIHWA